MQRGTIACPVSVNVFKVIADSAIIESVDKITAYIRAQPSLQFKRGEILIYQDTEPTVLYGIRSGFVKVHDIGNDGTEQLIWLAKKYDILPLEWLFGPEKTSHYFYTAYTDVSVFEIDKHAFLQQVTEDSEALLAIVKAITLKYNDLLRHVNATQKPKARDKLLHTLYFIAERFTPTKDSGLTKTVLPLTHQDLANLSGISRETASVELKRLKDEKIIHYDKTNFYINGKALENEIT